MSQQLLLALALLACPLGMGLMNRGQRQSGDREQSSAAVDPEITALRAQVDQLRADQREANQNRDVAPWPGQDGPR